MFYCCPMCSLTWYIVIVSSPLAFSVFHFLDSITCVSLSFLQLIVLTCVSLPSCINSPCLCSVVVSSWLFLLCCPVCFTLLVLSNVQCIFIQVSFVTFIKDRFLFPTSEVVWVCHFPVTVICFALLLRTKGRQRYYGRKWAPRAARPTRPARTKLPFCPTAWWCFYRLQSRWMSHFTFQTLLLNISKH